MEETEDGGGEGNKKAKDANKCGISCWGGKLEGEEMEGEGRTYQGVWQDRLWVLRVERRDVHIGLGLVGGSFGDLVRCDQESACRLYVQNYGSTL